MEQKTMKCDGCLRGGGGLHSNLCPETRLRTSFKIVSTLIMIVNSSLIETHYMRILKLKWANWEQDSAPAGETTPTLWPV